MAMAMATAIRSFAFYTQDDRYSVSTLTFVTVVNEARARELALRQLNASPHHLSVDVLEDDRLLFRVGRPTDDGRFAEDQAPHSDDCRTIAATEAPAPS